LLRLGASSSDAPICDGSEKADDDGDRADNKQRKQ
jgi:hypothetical protein